MIRIEINGKVRELEGPKSVGALLDSLGVDRRIVAVELNGEILDRDAFDRATVDAGSRVEVVRMIGGG